MIKKWSLPKRPHLWLVCGRTEVIIKNFFFLLWANKLKRLSFASCPSPAYHFLARRGWLTKEIHFEFFVLNGNDNKKVYNIDTCSVVDLAGPALGHLLVLGPFQQMPRMRVTWRHCHPLHFQTLSLTAIVF
jgi:hypothetical protein